MSDNTHLKTELETAKTVQQALLNTYQLESDSYKLAKACHPAQHLGGDFYYVSETHRPDTIESTTSNGIIRFQRAQQHTIQLFIGDVAGHGLSSALIMALCCGLIPKLLIEHPSPGDCLKQLNNQLVSYLKGSRVPYVTVGYAQYDVEKQIMTYAKAGHPAAIRLKADSELTHIEPKGTFLGMYPDETYEEKKVDFGPSDKLILYTDGIPESRDSKKRFFGMSAFEDVLIEHANRSCDTILNETFNALGQFLDQPAHDDHTLLVFGQS